MNNNNNDDATLNYIDPTTTQVNTNTEQSTKNINKKNLQVANFKMHKKLAQGIKVLCTQEQKKFDEIVSQTPTQNIIVIHFGNGEEDDYVGLDQYLNKFPEHTLHIFPGISYGYIEFKSVLDAQLLIGSSIKVPDNLVANSCEVKFPNRTRNVFFFYTYLKLTELCKSQQTNLPNASSKTEINGLKIIENFITPEEEKYLIQEIDKGKWYTLANRRVQHYGYEFIYGINTIDKNKCIGDFPEYCNVFKSKLEQISQDHNQPLMDQLTINDYFPGQGIPPHVDTHSPFEECFVSLSLGSGTVMSFKNNKGEAKHIFISQRSLIIFTGEARYAWSHAIAQRKLDKVDGKLFFRRRRISMTFRKVKFTPCQCQYPIYCDSQTSQPVTIEDNENEKIKKKNPEEGGLDYAEEIKIDNIIKKPIEEIKPTDWEKKYVYNTYEKIAPHFSHTRYKPWPKIEEFLNSLPKGTIIADVGCGNGKYLGVNQSNLCIVGTDRSENLLEIAKTRDNNFQVFSADSLRLPFKSNSVDCCISIAVIHHFSNRQLRLQAINELIRITKVNGLILIYVWAIEQEGRKFTQQDVLVPWHLQFKYEDEEKVSNLLKNAEASNDGDEKIEEIHEKSIEDSDTILDESRKTIVYKRYYHMFKYGELEDLIKEFPELVIVDSYYDHANWVVKCKRIK